MLRWVNQRRIRLGLPELEDLHPATPRSDPVCLSLGAKWVIGSLQVTDAHHIYQYDPPRYIHRWLAEYRDGKHPQYEPERLP